MAGEQYDLVVIGSGFGSLFFLKKFLALRPDSRVALVEWGRRRDHAWQIEHDRNSDIDAQDCHRSRKGEKPWNYTIGLGGGLNCWWAQAPRLLPEDFEMQSRYGVLADWPLDYDEIEPFYIEAEAIMQIAGDPAIAAVCPRSGPFPLPAHRMTTLDRAMAAAQPDRHFAFPAARASVPVAGRNACCASAWCHRCPADAKFSAFNGMAEVFDHPGVDIFTETQAWAIETASGRAEAVLCRSATGEIRLRGDLIVLGANGIQSPAILLRSGIEHPLTGVGICEQVSFLCEAMLAGLDNFDGGTVTTGINYSLYAGPHRTEAGAAMLAFDNFAKHGLRAEFGRWRQVLPISISVEDAPQDSSRVRIGVDGVAEVEHPTVSDYGQRGLDRALALLPEVLTPLPVEELLLHGPRPSESHVQCSLRMGNDPSHAVVDGLGRHHGVKDLVVVGSALFPTCPPANPSLTVAALALRSAERLAG